MAMKSLLYAVVLLVGLAGTALAQQRVTYYAYVDTAGTVPIGPDVYETWVFARQGDNYPPAAGILVDFDCGRQLVRRLAQVKYSIVDSVSGQVGGKVETIDNPKWEPVSNHSIVDAACEAGRRHAKEQQSEPVPTKKAPAHRESPYVEALQS